MGLRVGGRGCGWISDKDKILKAFWSTGFSRKVASKSSNLILKKIPWQRKMIYMQPIEACMDKNFDLRIVIHCPVMKLFCFKRGYRSGGWIRYPYHTIIMHQEYILYTKKLVLSEENAAVFKMHVPSRLQTNREKLKIYGQISKIFHHCCLGQLSINKTGWNSPRQHFSKGDAISSHKSKWGVYRFWMVYMMNISLSS